MAVNFYGDSEVLGRYIGELKIFPRSYLLILGTSTGGSYLGANGSYCEGVNLVSRIVIDLAEDAPKHTSTKAPGVLQQYSGSYGFKRALEAHRPTARIKFDLAESLSASLTLNDLLRSNKREDRHWAEESARLFADWIAIAVADLQTHYELDRVLLSGGSLQDLLGPTLIRYLTEKLETFNLKRLKVALLREITGWPSSHEVAIAAARLSSSSRKG
jgi:predicted NBD/HSP70 family sugar kinase